MTEHEMKRLETALARRLSPPVRQFFLNFPEALRDIERDEDFDGFELIDDPDALIEMNLEGKSYYLPHDWAPHMFILGADGSGLTFWADLNSQKGAVLCFEAGQAAEYSDDVADSLAEFAERLLDAHDESDDE